MTKKKVSTEAQKPALSKGAVIRCAIKCQGAPIINDGYVREIGKNIVALEIDLRS